MILSWSCVKMSSQIQCSGRVYKYSVSSESTTQDAVLAVIHTVDWCKTRRWWACVKMSSQIQCSGRVYKYSVSSESTTQDLVLAVIHTLDWCKTRRWRAWMKMSSQIQCSGRVQKYRFRLSQQLRMVWGWVLRFSVTDIQYHVRTTLHDSFLVFLLPHTSFTLNVGWYCILHVSKNTRLLITISRIPRPEPWQITVQYPKLLQIKTC